MNIARAMVVILVLCVVGYYAYTLGAGPQTGGGGSGGGSGGGGGGGVPCNIWQSYNPDLDQWPVWASNMPGCNSVLCLTPGIAVTADGDVCVGGGGTDGQADTGNLYGAACPAAGTVGVVPFSADSALYYINRNPACGPWQATNDPAAAFAFQGVPVCFPAQGPAGVLAPYISSVCAAAPGFGGDWQMLANDTVPAGP